MQRGSDESLLGGDDDDNVGLGDDDSFVAPVSSSSSGDDERAARGGAAPRARQGRRGASGRARCGGARCGRRRGGGLRLDELVVEPGWQKMDDVVPDAVHPFNEPSGPTVPLPPDACPIAFFDQMFGEAFFDRMAEATNANAAARRPPLVATVDVNATSDPHWNMTTAAEMRAFIGLNIAMGFKDLPEYRDYWSEEPILHDEFVANIMSRRRYEKFVEYFHCSMPAEETADDKLTKVRPLITLCTENFRRCFAPCQDLSVDEAMIRFYWRLAWKQYMPKKPVKWASSCSASAMQNTGYCLGFSVYTGAMNVVPGNPGVNLDLGYRVVMELMHYHLLRHHHLYADNYFTSVHLAADLLQADTYLCGTTRSTRHSTQLFTPGGSLCLDQAVGLTYNVVMKLMSPRYLMRYHHMYADNFNTSLPLVRDLRDTDTYDCGTIRKNSRGVPTQMSTVRLQRGKTEILVGDHDIVLTRWRDKRGNQHRWI